MICYIGLGSNDGDRELHLHNGLNNLAEISDNIYFSTHYESPALNPGKVYYLNSVALIEFSGTLDALNTLLKKFEIQEGRTPEARAEGRVPLDMDVVIADGKILRTKDYNCYFFRRGYEELRPHPSNNQD